MRLYHKQLNSVADLRREQRRLKRVQKKAEAATNTVADSEDGFSLQGILDSFLGAKEGGGSLLRNLEPLLLNLVIKKHKKPSLVVKVLKEVLGGYVKWKSIDLSYTLIKRLIQKRQNKRREHTGH